MEQFRKRVIKDLIENHVIVPEPDLRKEVEEIFREWKCGGISSVMAMNKIMYALERK